MAAEVVQEAALLDIQSMPGNTGPSENVKVKGKLKVDGGSEDFLLHEISNPSICRPKAAVEVDHDKGLVANS